MSRVLNETLPFLKGYLTSKVHVWVLKIRMGVEISYYRLLICLWGGVWT